jgi:ArsR family transcriptional regulator, arsenate/arsenite/antimonite-responsive transcriptional repressor
MQTAGTRSRSQKASSPRGPAIRVSDTTLLRLKDVFKMLADEHRLKIVLALAQDGELNVTALCSLVRQSQPAVSHHLTLMRMIGLVGYRREGKHNFYYLASTYVRDLLEDFFADAGNSQKALHFEEFALTFKRR